MNEKFFRKVLFILRYELQEAGKAAGYAMRHQWRKSGGGRLGVSP